MKLGVLAACLAVATGCGAHRTATVTASQTVAGVTAALTTTPTPPHTGDDTLILTLMDASTGTPVGDANITTTANMLSPRLPGSPVTGRAQGNGVYQFPVRLGIATRYNIQMRVERPGHASATFTFPIEAQQ